MGVKRSSAQARRLAKEMPTRPGDQAEHGELDREDGGDAGAGGAEGLEHDDLAHAAVLGAGDGGGEDDDAAKIEKAERNWTT